MLGTTHYVHILLPESGLDLEDHLTQILQTTSGSLDWDDKIVEQLERRGIKEISPILSVQQTWDFPTLSIPLEIRTVQYMPMRKALTVLLDRVAGRSLSSLNQKLFKENTKFMRISLQLRIGSYGIRAHLEQSYVLIEEVEPEIFWDQEIFVNEPA